MTKMCVLAWVVLAACGGDSKNTTDTVTDTKGDTSAPDTSAPDSTVPDTVAPDTSMPDSSDADTADTAADSTADVADSVADTAADTRDDSDDSATDAQNEDVPTHVDDLGFSIRVPQMRTIPAEDFGGNPTTDQRSDIDHVCKIDVDGFDGYLYERANPVHCSGFMGCEYEVTGAWTKLGDTIAPLAGVAYGYGGNHHNDFITMPNGAHTLKIYHSSFGFGFRSCQPPDCAQVYDGDTLATDGCAADRSLPVICVEIDADGSEPALVDTFARCDGDPNGP